MPKFEKKNVNFQGEGGQGNKMENFWKSQGSHGKIQEGRLHDWGIFFFFLEKPYKIWFLISFSRFVHTDNSYKSFFQDEYNTQFYEKFVVYHIDMPGQVE